MDNVQIPKQAEEKRPGSLLHHVEELNQMEREEEVEQRAKASKLRYVDLMSFPISKDALVLISKKEAYHYRIVPFYVQGKQVHLATTVPNSSEYSAVAKLLNSKGWQVEQVLVSQAGMEYVLHLYPEKLGTDELLSDISLDETHLGSLQEELQKARGLQEEVSHMTEQDVYRQLFITALSLHASDIHLQPELHNVVVRYRVDGDLHTVFFLDYHMYQHVLTRLKFTADLKLNITDIPQDGKFALDVSVRRVGVRLSLLPTENGESVVMRLLDSKTTSKGMSELGFEPYVLNNFHKALSAPEGMILVTGPTGSGKTTTLYALLAQLNQEQRKIITLEDPIEYHLSGISQSQIKESAGYTFAGGLRSILRQDPDVIMLGEIRDEETAKTAVQSALTGHMVLSTVHANSAIEAIPRMRYMGVLSYLLAPALSLLVAQRLIRTLCTHCSVEEKISIHEQKLLTEVIARVEGQGTSSKISLPKKLKRAKGCAKCGNTGYLGRCSIIETVCVTKQLQEAIYAEETSNKLLDIARREGMISMKEDGLVKVMQGTTTMEEVLRVAG